MVVAVVVVVVVLCCVVLCGEEREEVGRWEVVGGVEGGVGVVVRGGG